MPPSLPSSPAKPDTAAAASPPPPSSVEPNPKKRRKVSEPTTPPHPKRPGKPDPDSAASDSASASASASAPAPAPAADRKQTPPPSRDDDMTATATAPAQSAARGHQVLRELLLSNRSYTAGDSKAQSELSSPSLRTDLAEHGQRPVAAIIACADSRVAPEIVFGVGLGQVFVIRNAGNAAWGDSVIGSLEYAVGNLDVPLVMVLGHSLCGAITAAVGAARDGACMEKVDSVEDPLSKHVYRLADVVKTECDKEDAVRVAVVKNVRAGVQMLKEGKSKVAELAAAEKIAIVGAVYDLHTGEVIVVQE